MEDHEAKETGLDQENDNTQHNDNQHKEESGQDHNDDKLQV